MPKPTYHPELCMAQVGLIAFNLFTTVILENFERVQDTEAWKLTPANLDVSLAAEQ